MNIIKPFVNNSFTHVEIKSLNADGSLSIDFLQLSDTGEVIHRENNYVIPAPLPFELSDEEIAILSPTDFTEIV